MQSSVIFLCLLLFISTSAFSFSKESKPLLDLPIGYSFVFHLRYNITNKVTGYNGTVYVKENRFNVDRFHFRSNNTQYVFSDQGCQLYDSEITMVTALDYVTVTNFVNKTCRHGKALGNLFNSKKSQLCVSLNGKLPYWLQYGNTRIVYSNFKPRNQSLIPVLPKICRHLIDKLNFPKHNFSYFLDVNYPNGDKDYERGIVLPNVSYYDQQYTGFVATFWHLSNGTEFLLNEGECSEGINLPFIIFDNFYVFSYPKTEGEACKSLDGKSNGKLWKMLSSTLCTNWEGTVPFWLKQSDRTISFRYFNYTEEVPLPLVCSEPSKGLYFQ